MRVLMVRRAPHCYQGRSLRAVISLEVERAMEKNPASAAGPAAANDATLLKPAGRTLDVPALRAALAGSRADSQRDPETYLQDTVVPSGGE
jgi:hypothetical protein